MTMPTVGIHRAIRVHWIVGIQWAIGIHRIIHAALPPTLGIIRVQRIVGIQWAIGIHRIIHAALPGRVVRAIVIVRATARAPEDQADDRPQDAQKDEHKDQPDKSQDNHDNGKLGGRYRRKQLLNLTQPVGHSILLFAAESRFECPFTDELRNALALCYFEYNLSPLLCQWRISQI
jgi:hypothetical protein